MQAALLEKYDKEGTDLVIQDVPMPEVGPDDVQVKIIAAAVNPLDNMIIRGEVRLIVPYEVPFIMGNEMVGTVEKTGSNAHRFKEGQRVYCRMPLDRIGAFAEYAAVNEDALAATPDYLTDDEAAAVPLTALTADQAYNLMDALPDSTLFISGGSGSVGAMAIPIAKARGLKVVTNGGASEEQRVLALGADRYIDYRKEDFSKVLHDVDEVLDTLGDKALPAEFAIMRDGGTLVSLRGMPNGAFARRMHLPAWKRLLFDVAGMKYDRMAAKRHQHYDFMFVHADGVELERVSGMLADRKVRPAVGPAFDLKDVNEALAQVQKGGHSGKVVLHISKRS